MEERYQSMADVLDELNEFVKERTATDSGMLDLSNRSPQNRCGRFPCRNRSWQFRDAQW